MEVTVTVAGTPTETVEIEDGTYGDLIEAVGLSREEAAILVDGRPVPADAVVDASEVTVLRLIHGG